MSLKLSPTKTIHFLGIGGSGMSPLAGYLLERGWKVSGTDISESATTTALKDKGAILFHEHAISNLDNVQLVVISTAIKDDNIELQYAKKQGLHVMRRAEMLDYLMGYCDTRIAVAGTHGKTTTSGFVSKMLFDCDQDPHFVVGSVVVDFDSSYRTSPGSIFVAEADESDGTFLSLHPTHAVITNLEEEHMAYFETFDNLFDHFRRFMVSVRSRDGLVVYNGDDQHLQTLASEFDSPEFISYGLGEENCFRATNISFSTQGAAFDCEHNGNVLGHVQLAQFGIHNVHNALGTIALGISMGLDHKQVFEGVGAFSGTCRRMQFIGEHNDIRVYDDYGHHPTEINTTLNGVKESLKNRLVCIFQPHRFTRTRDLLGEFASAFSAADILIITDIYAAGEAEISGISSSVLANMATAQQEGSVFFVANKDAVPEFLNSKLQAGDIVVTMGAGDITHVSRALVSNLKESA
jgi:UDP-N-acetylmuramate--alanine ligase